MSYYTKYLIHTTFVSSAAFYTNLFDVDWWDRQKKDDKNELPSWKTVVDERLPLTMSANERAGVVRVANAVDELEQKLATQPTLRDTTGLGDQPGKGDVQGGRQFFQTLLLDRLVMAFELDPEGEPPKVTIYKRPDVHLKTGGKTERWEYSEVSLNRIIGDVNKAAAALGEDSFEFEEAEPTGSIKEVREEGDEVDQISTVLLEYDKEAYLGLATACKGAVFAGAVGVEARIMQNACALAVSALLLLEVSLLPYPPSFELSLAHARTATKRASTPGWRPI